MTARLGASGRWRGVRAWWTGAGVGRHEVRREHDVLRRVFAVGRRKSERDRRHGARQVGRRQ